MADDQLKTGAVALWEAFAHIYELINVRGGDAAAASQQAERLILDAVTNADLHVFVTDPKTRVDFRIQPQEVKDATELSFGPDKPEEGKEDVPSIKPVATFLADKIFALHDSALWKYNGRTPWVRELDFQNWLNRLGREDGSPQGKHAPKDGELDEDYLAHKKIVGRDLNRDEMRDWLAERPYYVKQEAGEELRKRHLDQPLKVGRKARGR